MISEEEKRKILFLTDDLGGGTGNHVLSMVKYWDRDLWQVEILSQARLTARVKPTVPIEFSAVPRKLAFYPIAQIYGLAQTCKYIAASPPDVVHCYFFWPTMYGRILKRMGKVRFLVENREDQGFNWGKHEYALLRLTRSLPDLIICVSDAVRDVVLRRESVNPERVLVVRNGVEPPQESAEDGHEVRNQLGLTEDNLVVGMVANFNRSVKGVAYFLESIPSIIKAVPSARFLILGRGREEGMLKEKAKSLGIEQYVIFAGYHEEVDRYYAIMDISVLTSLSEGLSITLLESMNHALPTVVTHVGGNSEVVIDGETGYLVPPKDIPSFINRVVKLLRDHDLRVRMGEAGRRVIKERFQTRYAAAQYLQAYESLLRG